jgi:hypothetical protein
MKGLISLPVNVVGYIIALAIFFAGILIINSFWYQFQTIPLERPEKSTACDLAYVISIWDEITAYPNIFDKSKITAQNEEEKEELENKIFEEGAGKFFVPGADLFFGIKEDETDWSYTLYIPPESKTVFDTCGKVTVAPKSYRELEKSDFSWWIFFPPEAISRATTNFIGEAFEEMKEKEYLESVKTYNEISGICHLPTFIKDGNEIRTGSMAAGFTSNIATWIREGIYRILVEGEDVYYHPLGDYPIGCLYNVGLKKYEEKKEEAWYQPFLDLLSWTRDQFPILYANCEFEWNWESENDRFIINVTTKKPGLLGGVNPQEAECRLLTRIPKKIVNEYNLNSKLCYPKKVTISVWFPEGWNPPGDFADKDKKYFYLKMEKLDIDSRNEQNAISYCKARCETDLSFFLSKSACKNWCDKGDNIFDKNCKSYATSPECMFAQDKIHEFYSLPPDAIDIKYVVVEEDKLEEKNWIFKKISESEYYDYKSVCASWPGVFDCESSKKCEGNQHCIRYGITEVEGKKKVDKHCGVCSTIDEGDFCSPGYLNDPPLVIQGYYACQNVINYSAPLNLNEIHECLPILRTNVTYDNSEILDLDGDGTPEINCSSKPDTKIKWKIKAKDICYKQEERRNEAGEIKTYSTTSGYCPKMKFWPSMDKSKTYYLDEVKLKPDYEIVIEQQVCRGNERYNNVDKVFIVADLYTDKAGVIRYILPNTEVEVVE